MDGRKLVKKEKEGERLVKGKDGERPCSTSSSTSSLRFTLTLELLRLPMGIMENWRTVLIYLRFKFSYYTASSSFIKHCRSAVNLRMRESQGRGLGAAPSQPAHVTLRYCWGRAGPRIVGAGEVSPSPEDSAAKAVRQ